LLGHSVIDRVGLRKLLWRAEALDLLGEGGEADDFRALTLEQFVELVDTQLNR